MARNTSVPVGIDTIGVTVPITSFDRTGCMASGRLSSWDRLASDQDVRYWRALDGGGRVSFGLGGVAWIEASLPKREYGHNIDGVPISDVPAAAARLLDEAGEFYRRDKRRKQIKLKRLDVVRDFRDVAEPSAMLDGLFAVPQPGRVKGRRYRDGERNNAEALAVGPKSEWRGVIYDKGAESGDLRARNQLRFEGRVRDRTLLSAWAQKNGIRPELGGRSKGVDAVLLEHVQGEWPERVCRKLFDRCGYSREVLSLDQVPALIEQAIPKRSRLPFVGYLALLGMGADPGKLLHRSSRYRYERWARELGISVAHGEAPVARLRLDFDRGELVRSVA